MSIFQKQRVKEAVCFAIDAHHGQYRKCNELYYITHPLGVAAIVDQYGGDEDQVIAALLHDVKEDCPNPFHAQIKDKFGERVDRLVDELTNTSKKLHPELNRAGRKKLDNERLKNISITAKLVKLADITYNVEDLHGLTGGFIAKFLSEKEQQLEAVIDEVPYLFETYHELHNRACRSIGSQWIRYVKGK